MGIPNESTVNQSYVKVLQSYMQKKAEPCQHAIVLASRKISSMTNSVTRKVCVGVGLSHES